MHKKRNDIMLILIILIISLGTFLVFKITEKKENLVAYIYYENELVETIELYKLGNEIVEYKIMGANGEMIIEAKYNAIKVESENSPYHYCSKQGFSSKSNEPIICLPNKVYIKLVGNSTGFDLEI